MDKSASRANLLLKCGFWARPDVDSPPSTSGPGARYGIAVHFFAEMYAAGLTPNYEIVAETQQLGPAELEQAKTDAWALYTWHKSHIGGEKWHEQKVAFDFVNRTSRVLTRPEPRDYSECTATEFPGTADLIAVKPDAVCVIDYKTGHTPWEIYIPQLNTLAVSAAKIYNRSRAVCIVLKVAHGELYPHHWVLDEAALLEFENELASALVRVPGSDPTPGPHCTSLYCPLAGTCPATCGFIAEETGLDTSAVPVDGVIKDDVQANKLYSLKLLLGKQRTAVDTSLKTYVDQTGGFIVDGSGKKYMKDNGSYKETRI